MNFKTLYSLTRKTLDEWMDDKAPKLAAALSYYTVFSLAPLLIIAIAVASIFLSSDAARGEVAQQLSSLLGPAGAQTIQSMIESTSKYYGKGGNIAATAIGILFLLFGATGVFGELQDSLNSIWKVDKKKTSGVKAYLKETVLSFAMVLGVGFLLTVSLLISAAVEGATHFLGQMFSDVAFLWEALNFGVSFVITGALFAAIFKVLPNVDLKWRDVWLGGTLTAILFVIGKTLLGIYIGRSGVTSAFGAAGSVVLILLWVYYTAQILFFCAEFTKVYTQYRAERRSPKPLPA